MSRSHPHDFPAAAREALADAQLRANLRGATQTIRARRAAAVAELPDFEELREQARRVKDDALDGSTSCWTSSRRPPRPPARASTARRMRRPPTPWSPASPATTA